MAVTMPRCITDDVIIGEYSLIFTDVQYLIGQ